MKKHTWYYNQIVTETDMNEATTWTQDAERNLARDVEEHGVFSGLTVSPTGPATTSVTVSVGVARDQNSGSRMGLQVLQTVPCDQDEFGNPTYTDLLPGEGRWCSLFARPKTLDSDLRTDGHGLPVWFTQTESIEFFLHLGTKGPAVNRATLARPGKLTTAVLLADIWFEAGAVEIELTDIEVNRRDDYYRATVSGVEIVAGNPKRALQQLGAVVDTNSANLEDPDLPTGANDGAHHVGLGGHATQSAWRWAGHYQLNAAGDNVHDVVEKIVSDLGEPQTQGVPGSRLVFAGSNTAQWADGTTVDPGTYDKSVGGYLDGIVRDLAGVEGGLKVGGDSSFGSPYSLSAVSLQAHDEELLTHLNHHVNTGGHPVNAISHPATTETFADGRVLAANQGVNRWNELVHILGEKPVGAGTAGDQAIGCGPVTQTRPAPPSPVGETLTLPGNQTLSQRSERLLYEILGRMRYNGDDRLTGVFQPENDAGADLGSATKRFGNLYTSAVRGSNLIVSGTGETVLESTSGTDNAIVRATNDVLLHADNLGATSGVIRFRTAASDKFHIVGGSILPVYAPSHLGSASNRFDDAFLRFGVDVSDPATRYRYVQACGGFVAGPTTTQPLFSINGSYLYNSAADAFNVFSPLDFLKPGDSLEEISIEIAPTAVGTITVSIYYQLFGSGGPILISTETSSTIGRHILDIPIGVSILNGRTFYVRVYTTATANQRLYGMRVAYKQYRWPI